MSRMIEFTLLFKSHVRSERIKFFLWLGRDEGGKKLIVKATEAKQSMIAAEE